MSLVETLQEQARARRERLFHPPGGHASSEDEIVAVARERRLRAQAEREERERIARAAAEWALRQRAGWISYAQFIHKLAHNFGEQERKPIRVEDIQRAVCKFYNVSRVDLLSDRRTASVVYPRQIAVYLAKMITLKSLPELGRRFGGRDHTTALAAIRKIQRLVDAGDRRVIGDLGLVKAQLGFKPE